MVPTEGEQAAQAEGQAAAEGQAPQGGERVMTPHAIGATLDGIPYGRLASNPNLFVSDPIADPKVIERLLTIPGFTLVTSLSPEDEQAVETANATTRKREAEKATQGGEDTTVLRRTVEELTQANMNMATELGDTRAERDEARRLLASSEVPRLQQQIEQLRMEVEQGGGASIALQAENERLRATNAQLAKALTDATAKPVAREHEHVPEAAADSMG